MPSCDFCRSSVCACNEHFARGSGKLSYAVYDRFDSIARLLYVFTREFCNGRPPVQWSSAALHELSSCAAKSYGDVLLADVSGKFCKRCFRGIIAPHFFEIIHFRHHVLGIPRARR